MTDDSDGSDTSREFPRWVPWLSLCMFFVGLYGGYANGGTGGFLAVWFGAGGLSFAVAVVAEQ